MHRNKFGSASVLKLVSEFVTRLHPTKSSQLDVSGAVDTSISKNEGLPVASLYKMVWSHLQFMEVMQSAQTDGSLKGEFFVVVCGR